MRRFVNEALFWICGGTATLGGAGVLVSVVDGHWWLALIFAGVALVNGTIAASSLDDLKADAEDDLKALRSIVQNYQDGYEPDLERGGWVKTLYYHDSPPEWEGHPFTPREQELLTKHQSLRSDR